MKTWKHVLDKNALPRNYYTWRLDRPAAALPSSYFWTWDHSTNWVLDDPGNQTSGCKNLYLKHPDTFVEDYRRLIDLAAGTGIRGIVIWGFLRDAHGGMEYARRVTAYAEEQGVDIYPGIGITAYDGVYYEGAHRYNLPEFLKKNPDCRLMKEDGSVREDWACGCIAHPKFREWFAESIQWLFKEINVKGFNLENGDLLVDYHPLTKKLREESNWPKEDSEVFFNQAMSYKLALDSVPADLSSVFASYATYTGFHTGQGPTPNGPMGMKPPVMLKHLPEQAVCQWTLTAMLKELPATDYLDDGAPAAVYDNPKWGRDLRPPSVRSVGFIHQGSQWWNASRNKLVISSIKEACLRGYQSGLEGISIHGEVSSRHFNWAMNYLAFSHFTHYPEDSMIGFGRKTLGQVLGTEKDGEDFAVALCHLSAGALKEEHRALADPANHGFPGPQFTARCNDTDEFQRCRLWTQLKAQVDRALDKQVVTSTPDLPEFAME